MAENLQQRVVERRIYEEIVNMVVNYVYKEFENDEAARLRVYALVADNFDGMVRALKKPPKDSPTLIEIIENVQDYPILP